MVSEVWVFDFEYRDAERGNPPRPVCLCAAEINTGKTIRLWLDGYEKPEPPIDFKNLEITYVTYYGVAEISCHLVLGWDVPVNILDLFYEWRVLTNDGTSRENSLLAACHHFGIPTIDSEYKEKMRARIQAGPPYSEPEKQEILDYCNTDVVMASALYVKLHPLIDSIDRAYFRGKYMGIVAQIEHTGIPVDEETLTLICKNWDI